ncbi:MAG: type II/IV secretion system protein [Acidobacteria bacterium]|nr:type II/IV secretion system protein [Acidobacteriota bacterium]
MASTESNATTQNLSTNGGTRQASARSGAKAAEDARRYQAEESAASLAARYRLPYVDLRTANIDYGLVERLPVDFLVRNQVIPLDRAGGAQVFAVADPANFELIDELEQKVGQRVEMAIASPLALDEALKRGNASSRIMHEQTRAIGVSVVRETEQGEEVVDIAAIASDEETAPVIRIINLIVFNALERRASDIHIETRDTEMAVKYRIDGALYPATDPIDIRYAQNIIARIKVMSELDIAERRVPQDGRFRVLVRGRKIDFRVSIMPTVFGEDAVIRILDKEQINESFRELNLTTVGMAERDLVKFRRFIAEPYGMVLVTGPTGSGKTTTLYAALNEIRNDEDKLITIEDPVEYQLQGITQIPVNEKKGLTFARGLRSILRHDPDKIMVGEIRDNETAQIAINAALTGHLVFTTVHANNVIDVIGRFMNMGVEAYQFVSSLNCVLAQRLVRTLCPRCKQAVVPDEQELKDAGLDPETVKDWTFYSNVGCEICNFTGYRGRTSIHELLDVTDNIRELILERRPGSEIRRAARGEGLISLREAAIDRIAEGVTTLHEINRVTFVE